SSRCSGERGGLGVLSDEPQGRNARAVTHPPFFEVELDDPGSCRRKKIGVDLDERRVLVIAGGKQLDRKSPTCGERSRDLRERQTVAQETGPCYMRTEVEITEREPRPTNP